MTTARQEMCSIATIRTVISQLDRKTNNDQGMTINCNYSKLMMSHSRAADGKAEYCVETLVVQQVNFDDLGICIFKIRLFIYTFGFWCFG